MDTPAEQMQFQQAREQRATHAITGGLQFLDDETVIGPIKHAEGIADLKWLLRTLLAGQFGIDFGKPQAPPPEE